MKFLDAKRKAGPSSNKMAAGPTSNKSEVAGGNPPPAPTAPIASPAAVRLAEELGVDLTKVVGTGRDGTIVSADVRLAAEQAKPSTQE